MTTAATAAQLSDYVELADRLPTMLPVVERVCEVLIDRLGAGGAVYSFGNGGSAADAQHLTGELAGHFRRDRRALRAATIGADPVLLTAVGNDYDFTEVFSRPLSALAEPGDVVCAFTTSGTSPNVLAALRVAHDQGAVSVLFSGADGGEAAGLADHALLVPSIETARIQEVHTLLVHLISDRLDEWAAQ